MRATGYCNIYTHMRLVLSSIRGCPGSGTAGGKTRKGDMLAKYSTARNEENATKVHLPESKIFRDATQEGTGRHFIMIILISLQ